MGRTVPPYSLTAPRTSSVRNRRQIHLPAGAAGQYSGWPSTVYEFMVAQKRSCMIETEDVPKLVGHDERHRVTVLAVPDPDLRVEEAAVRPLNVRISCHLEPADPEQHLALRRELLTNWTRAPLVFHA